MFVILTDWETSSFIRVNVNRIVLYMPKDSGTFILLEDEMKIAVKESVVQIDKLVEKLGGAVHA